ncbi:MAG: hypothetical protein MZV63_13625 [Marinilabiliales bacterium]|nr:hypothetical protein [Marinilabiliales bacterium]
MDDLQALALDPDLDLAEAPVRPVRGRPVIQEIVVAGSLGRLAQGEVRVGRALGEPARRNGHLLESGEDVGGQVLHAGGHARAADALGVQREARRLGDEQGMDGDRGVREIALDPVHVEAHRFEQLGLPVFGEAVLRQDVPLEDEEDVLVPLEGFQRVGEADHPGLGDLRQVPHLPGDVEEHGLLDVGLLRREVLLLELVEVPHQAAVAGVAELDVDLELVPEGLRDPLPRDAGQGLGFEPVGLDRRDHDEGIPIADDLGEEMVQRARDLGQVLLEVEVEDVVADGPRGGRGGGRGPLFPEDLPVPDQVDGLEGLPDAVLVDLEVGER